MQKSEKPAKDSKTDKPRTARARGRPREFDREAALARATRLFWLKGYDATSITDLTEAMGIGAPSLYAAFGSKERLFAEALHHYLENYDALGWGKFFTAGTAREAIESLLLDSATALTGGMSDTPRGCMLVLSAVGSEGHSELGELVKSARAEMLKRLKGRLTKALADGELPAAIDVHALSRFVQTVQNGMSLLARDGASSAELEAVAKVAMMGWDAHTRDCNGVS